VVGSSKQTSSGRWPAPSRAAPAGACRRRTGHHVVHPLERHLGATEQIGGAVADAPEVPPAGGGEALGDVAAGGDPQVEPLGGVLVDDRQLVDAQRPTLGRRRE
jgi:hypothetical protein